MGRRKLTCVLPVLQVSKPCNRQGRNCDCRGYVRTSIAPDAALVAESAMIARIYLLLFCGGLRPCPPDCLNAVIVVALTDTVHVREISWRSSCSPCCCCDLSAVVTVPAVLTS